MSHLIGIIFLAIVVTFIFYSIVPNILTRVFHWTGILQCSSDNRIALTFDDGPHPVYTPLVLDALLLANIRATFFVLAHEAKTYPDIIKRMVAEGHDVQVHGYHHAFVPFIGLQQTVQQVQMSAEVLRDCLGTTTKFYRPTWGLCNLWTFFVLRKMHHKLVLWSVMVGDWRVTAPEVLLERVANKLHQGAIVVLHDSDLTPGAQRGAPESVIAIIPHLAKLSRDKGYAWTTLSETL